MTKGSEKQGRAIVWFRDDLRLAENPALSAAAASRLPILCLYVFDETSEGLRPLGGAARWFLHGALAALSEAIESQGGELAIFKGSAARLIADCAAALDAQAVFWNLRYDNAGREIDTAIEAKLRTSGIEIQTFNANLLHAPDALLSASRKPFQIFTPFWRSVLAQGEPAPPPAAPRGVDFQKVPSAALCRNSAPCRRISFMRPGKRRRSNSQRQE
jgi:deoxyribodipyrimidine photo-lyase